MNNAWDILLIGFDSAWSAKNRGALIGVIKRHNGTYIELLPELCNFDEAEARILRLQNQYQPATTIVMLDQPTIVENVNGQRPVENLVSSAVGRRLGGVQPSNKSRQQLFGKDAPIWKFLGKFGGAGDPLSPVTDKIVFETYPVLTMIALGWTRLGAGSTGRLPKYNPVRKKTFLLDDWRFVCCQLKQEFQNRNLTDFATWVEAAACNESPEKADQDKLDACICLLAGLYLVEGNDCLMVGCLSHGYMVVPNSDALREELMARCAEKFVSSDQVKTFRISVH